MVHPLELQRHDCYDRNNQQWCNYRWHCPQEITCLLYVSGHSQKRGVASRGWSVRSFWNPAMLATASTTAIHQPLFYLSLSLPFSLFFCLCPVFLFIQLFRGSSSRFGEREEKRGWDTLAYISRYFTELGESDARSEAVGELCIRWPSWQEISSRWTSIDPPYVPKNDSEPERRTGSILFPFFSFFFSRLA